jgi:hypothetical protein
MDTRQPAKTERGKRMNKEPAITGNAPKESKEPKASDTGSSLLTGDVTAIVKQSRGKPTKFRAKTVRRLLKCISNGLEIGQACKAAGIGTSTLHDWKQEYPDLVPLLDKAREQAREKALSAIKDIAERQDDYKAWESFLRYSFAADYQRGGQINVNASTTVQPVMIDEATRARLTGQRQALLDRVAGKVIEAEVVEPERTEQAPATETETEEGTGPGFDSQQLQADYEVEKKRPKSQEDSYRELFGDPEDREERGWGGGH